MSPNLLPDTSTPLSALLHGAAFAPLPNIGWIRVTGEDRVRWLNGMATNSIATLSPGEGCYNFFLNAQGRILGDATAWILEDSILLETQREQIPTLLAHLEHFIIMDDVELAPVDDLQGIQIAGPRSFSIVRDLGTRNGAAQPCSPAAMHSQPPQTETPWLLLRQTQYSGATVSLIRNHTPIVTRFELWSDPATISAIAMELSHTPESGAPGLASETWEGPTQASPADIEQLRILSGTPLYGTDIRNTETHKDLPQETAQDKRALHFSKGCYLGQEIVERIRSRGAVHRTFTGFTLNGELPAAGTQLFAADKPEKPVGELTSVTSIGDTQIALGYIRREALDLHERIEYPGGTAIPTSLPFDISTL